MVDSPLPRTGVSKERERTSHGLHLFRTIVTAGPRGTIVWFPLTPWHAFGPRGRIATTYR